MRYLLIISAIAVLAISVFSYVRAPYSAQFCGNVMVTNAQVPDAIELVHKQGCREAITYPVYDEFYGDAVVVYGVKIVAPTTGE